SRTCSETPSMMRGPLPDLPSETTRLPMSRIVLVMSAFSPSFRGGSKSRARNLEIPGSMLTHRPGMTVAARNDVVGSSLALPMLHARIERVAGGVADQVDAEDRDREQQPRPEDQGRLDLKIGAALGHDVAPGRRLRADAGTEERQNGFGQNGG